MDVKKHLCAFYDGVKLRPSDLGNRSRGYRTAPIEALDSDNADCEDSIWAEWNPLRDVIAGHDSGWHIRDPKIQLEQQCASISKDTFSLCIRYAKEFGDPILDLCCGTGHFTIPLVQAGYEVVGLDYNEDFLGCAQSQLGSIPPDVQSRLTFVLADAREFQLDREFRLIICLGLSFQSFLTQDDQLKCLSAVYDHLDEHGAFIVHHRFRWGDFGRHGVVEEGVAEFAGSEYACSTLYDPIEQVRFCYVRPAEDIDTPPAFYESFRTVSWQEVQLLHRITGFELTEVYHRFDSTRFDAWMVLLKGKRWSKPEE